MEELSQTTQQVCEIIGVVFACIIILGAIAFVIILIYQDMKTAQLRKQYIDTIVNEHDKAILLEYKNQEYSILDRKNKKCQH